MAADDLNIDESQDAPQSLTGALRTAQRRNDLDALARLVDAHPELEFADDPDQLAIYAVALFYLKRRQEASAALNALDAAALPHDPDAWADYGLGLFLAGRGDEALNALRRAGDMTDPPAVVYARLGALHTNRQELDSAAEAFEQALARVPDWPEMLSNLGGVRFRQGALQEAVELYDRALQLRPDLAQTRDMRAKALLTLDRAEEMIEEAQDVLDRQPHEPTAHLYLARVQMQAERWAQAEATLNAAIDRFPERDDLKRTLVTLLFDQQAWWRAGLRLKDWAEERDEPDWVALALNRARVESRLLDAAEQSLDQVADTHLAQDPQYPVLRARILIERSRAEEAVELLEDAVARFPGNAEAVNLLSHTLTSLGRIDEANSYLSDVAQSNPMAVVRDVQARDNKAEDHEIEQLEGLFASKVMNADQRARVGFTLASAHDKRKDYHRAFEVLGEANALARRRLNYDWREHRRMTERAVDVIDADVVARLQGLGAPHRRPIFVVGMPRSGTTLTEQILCSHPTVYGAGELPWVPRVRALMPKVVEGGLTYPDAMTALSESNLKSAAAYYLRRLAAQENESSRVVDKLPHNFDNVALIALMFPNAPIIHMDREPRDVAVSNFYQDFAAKQGLMGFAYDLRDIGHMLNDHDRIMQHWHALFPGRIYELSYQKLVTEPEATIRDLLAFCGLEWDERVMRFYETQRPVRTASIRQVREGIYQTSSQKWRRYEAFLGPLEEVLTEGYKPLDEADTSTAGQALAGPTGAITG
jgi:tetratricopeptide (TPR) repeat protein